MHDVVCVVVQCQQMRLRHLAQVNDMRQAHAKEVDTREQHLEAIVEEAQQKEEEAQAKEQELVSTAALKSPSLLFECLL